MELHTKVWENLIELHAAMWVCFLKKLEALLFNMPLYTVRFKDIIKLSTA
jgi:hypothetical protein